MIEQNTLVLVRGEPMGEMPTDLYIPPEALEIFLDNFQGPLDLLLYLIRRHNLEVLDIPMAELTRQYMSYVELMRANQLELAADYLLMAALLIEIKSRMLLPVPNDVPPEEADPRAELVRRLLAYEQIKNAAQTLDTLPQVDRDFSVVQIDASHDVVQARPQVSVENLVMAWAELLNRAKIYSHHVVTREQLSVKEYMRWLTKRLAGGDFVSFLDLFDEPHEIAKLVVVFLAILELVRENVLEFTQRAAFAPIYVKLVG